MKIIGKIIYCKNCNKEFFQKEIDNPYCKDCTDIGYKITTLTWADVIELEKDVIEANKKYYTT